MTSIFHSLTKPFFLLLLAFFTATHTVQSFAQNPTKMDSVNLLVINGKYESAISDLKAIIIEDSLNFNAYYKLGYCYLSIFQYDSALIFLKQGQQINPENINILTSIGKVSDVLGYPQQARAAFEQICELDSSNRYAAISLGKLYLQSSFFVKADSVYKYLVSSDPTNSYFYQQLGLCAVKTDSLANAIIYFNKSLILNPLNIDVILQLSQVYYIYDELDLANQIVDQGLRAYPESLSLLKRKAEILYKQKEYKKAAPYFEQVIKMEDSSAKIYKKLGLCYFWQEEATFAMLNLYKSFLKDSSDAMTSFYLGLSYKDHKSYDKSIFYLNKALQLSIPGYLSDIFVQLGASFEQIKEFIPAIQNYREAITNDPSRKVLTFYLASVYDQYYADREVPLLYYQKFLRENKDADEKLIIFAEKRIKAIKQEIFFRKK